MTNSVIQMFGGINMKWWLHTSISDKGIEVTGIDSRVVIPYEECGDIFAELFEYAINLEKMNFKNILYKEDYFLIAPFTLPPKSEEDNFKDLRYTIKSYRYIGSILLSTGMFLDLKDEGEALTFNFLQEDIGHRADFLEYFLLNSSPKIKESGYYSGRVELYFYRLIQEMYLLGVNGNPICRWMLSFRTPLQIWFIALVQIIYLMATESSKISDRKYYKNTSKSKKNIDADCRSVVERMKNKNWFCMGEAINYTVSQLMIEPTSPLATLYKNYLDSLNKQAYALKLNLYYKIL